jgi:hypothetical protein
MTGAVARNGRGIQVIRKAVLLMIPLAAAGLAASQWQDITRYLKIKQMSMGTGHPENVPAGGSQAYPKP